VDLLDANGIFGGHILLYNDDGKRRRRSDGKGILLWIQWVHRSDAGLAGTGGIADRYGDQVR